MKKYHPANVETATVASAGHRPEKYATRMIAGMKRAKGIPEGTMPANANRITSAAMNAPAAKTQAPIDRVGSGNGLGKVIVAPRPPLASDRASGPKASIVSSSI